MTKIIIVFSQTHNSAFVTYLSVGIVVHVYLYHLLPCQNNRLSNFFSNQSIFKKNFRNLK